MLLKIVVCDTWKLLITYMFIIFFTEVRRLFVTETMHSGNDDDDGLQLRLKTESRIK